MGQTVKLRRSAVSGRVPNNSQLQLGELSMNTTDGKIFLAKSGSGGPSIEEVIITNTQNTGSLDIVGSISGSFLTGSFIGDGSGLYNIPASGVTGLSLDKISSGASTASIDANGLQINVNTSITGSLTATEFTGSGLGLRNVPINVSGSDENSITYDGQFTQFLFDDSTGIKVSGDTSTGTAKIYLDGVAAENEGGIGVTAKLEVTGATSTWTFDHDLGEQYPAITVFDSDGYVIIPQNIEAVSSTQLVITFSSPQTGVATATIGGGLPAISSSYGGRLLTVNSDGTFAEWKESIYLQTGSFETYTSSVNDRFNSIESFTSSIDETYATDEDVTDLRNDLNLYTSSTDDRLDSLETASGSLNSFTSSINTTIKTKLNTETVVSGSEQVVSLLSNQDVDLGTGDITAVTGSFGQLSIDDTIRATNFTGSFLRLDQNGAGLRMTNVGAFDNDGSNNFRIFSTNDLIIATGGDSGTAITIDSSTKDATFQGNIVLSGTVDGVDVSELKTNYDTSTGSHDGRLDSLETTTGSLDGRLDTIETTFSTSVNQRLFNVESSTEDNADNFMSYTSSTDDRLDSLETTSGSHNTRIGNLETFETKVDNGLEFTGSNVTIKGNLLVKGIETRVDSTTVDLSDNIISLNGSGASNAGIEVRDTTSPGLLSGSLIWDSTNNYWLGGTKSNEERLLTNTDLTNLDGRLDSLETDSGSIRSDFNSYTSSNDNNINGIDGRLGSLETTSGSHDGRLDSLESFTSSIDDTYATDQDITDLRGDFNTYTSSNDTTNTTQNSRLTSLESATGSYTTTDYYTTGATFNQINGVVTGTRNDGGTWTVDLDGRYLTGYTESDPIFSASPSANIADSDIENWNTAYGWGDHAQSGYLTSYNNEYTTGATFNQINGVVTFTRNDGDTFTVDLDGRYLTGYTETDPIFSASPSANIVDSDIENWNLAHGWGDHSQVGYLTSHPNVVAATSSNNSGRTYIQDILLDSNGHVTGLTTSTETVVNTDEYTTGVTWNGTTAVLTFTRNDGDTYSVTMLETLSDVTVTGGTYNSGTQTLRLTKSDGSTVDVSGFAVDTDTNWYTTGATFNNANGILTIVGKGMSDVTVDLDGRYLTSYNDEYTTGATFNQLNGVVTFTRNDGDTFTVDLDGRYLTGYTETDPIFSASPSANIADSDIENWNLAHGWGDHSQAGYLTSYNNEYVTGATFNQLNGVVTFTRNDGDTFTVDLDGRYLQSFTETDPIFSASPSANIADSDIENWNLAHGWGDHATQGYLTSYNNEYVTGASWNNSTAVLTFTRNDGDTFSVTLLDTLSDVTVTGGTYDSGTQTLELTKNDGSTISVSGFAIDTDINYYLTGSTFNTSDGVLTLKVKGSSDVTVDLDGRYLTGYTETDPIFSASPSANIADSDIENWNLAHGWGDHSQAGYLTSYNNEYTTGATFNTGNGIITFTRNDGDTFTVDIDGRFLTSYSETDTLNTVTSRGSTTSNSISVGDFQASHQSAQDATTKAEMLSMAVAKFKPHSTNSGTLAIAQVDNGNSVGLQYTNGAGTADWDMSLQPFGGNVGINKINPSGALHVYSGTSERFLISGDVHVQGSTDLNINGTSRRFSFTSGTGTIRTTTANELYLQTNSTTAITIDTNQNVTIGGELNIIKNNVGISTGYATVAIEATDAQLDLTSSSDGTWGSSINLVEGTDTTANTDVWSIARKTTNGAGDSSLNFNFGTANQHDNTARVIFTKDGAGTFTGNISANNLSGTNTGDQDLSGYLLNTTDTFTGNLTFNGGNNTSKESFINVKRGNGAGLWLKFQTDSTSANDVSQFVIRRSTDNVDILSITAGSGNLSVPGTLSASGYNDSNWNTAYGWGDHSTQNYLKGSNSSGTYEGTVTDWNSPTVTGFYSDDGATNRWSGQANWTSIMHVKLYDDNNNYATQIGFNTYDDGLYTRTNVGGTWTSWKQIYHSGVFTNNSSNWDTAYGWGDHSQAGYLTTYNNEYVTGASWNSSTAVLTFTRNDGDTFNVNLLNTLSDVTVTGGTYNSGNQTLTLTKSDGNTVSVSGFAIDTDVNYYTTGATFNTGNGIITGTRNDGGTWTVDIDNRYLQLDGGVLTGNIGRSAHNNGFLVGGYNNVGVSASATNPIFTIGTSYLPAVTTLGNMYGIGYTRADASFMGIASGSGWGMYVAADGDARIWLDGSSGNIVASGTLSASGYNDSNWNTAYGWGDHSQAGYLTTYNNEYTTGATFNTGNGIITFTRNDGDTYSVDIDGRYSLSSHTHSSFGDMVTFETARTLNEDWENSPISVLERDSIGNGDTSDTYSPNINFHWRSRVSRSIWMDYTGDFHFGEYTAQGVPGNTGAIYVGGGNSDQWNTAYGWGDHAGLYAAASHNHDSRYYTETEIDTQNTTLNETLAHLRGWVPGYSNSDDGSVRWNRTEDALELQSSSDTATGAVYKARRVEAGETIRFTVMVKGSSAGTAGLYLRIYQHDGNLPDGKTHVSNDAGGVYVQEDDRGDTGWYENDAIATTWITHVREYTAPVDGYVSLVVLNWTSIGNGSVYLKTPDIQTTQSPNSNKLDGLDSSQFLRSDAADSLTATITMSTQKAFVASNYGHGVYGTYDASKYQHVWSMGTSYNLPADGDSSGNGGNLYGLAWSYNPDYGYVGSNTQSKNGLNHQLLLMMNGVTHTALGSGIWTDGTIITTSHGDSSQWNTAYGWGDHGAEGYWTSHADTSTLSGQYGGANNGVVIEDITVDSNGHVTAVGTRDLDGRFLGISATAADSDKLDAYQLAGSTSVSTVIFNNKGQIHDTNQDFNTVMTPGPNYMRKGINGPTGVENDQWYGLMLGLGSDYGTSTGSSGHYGNQLYWGRQSQGDNTYLWARDMEGGSWGSWRKMSAGYADSAGSATSAGNADTLDGQHGSYYTNAGNLTGTIGDVFSASTRYNIGFIDGSSSQSRDKLRVWADGSYSIGMKNGYDFGHLGSGEYAMSFQMDTTPGRGWWWGTSTQTDDQGVMALTNDGRLNVSTSISIGEGKSTTSPSTTPLYVEGTTSGSTVFEVQGTQGQLFSITDDLSGDLFEVSDISGIPILTVNASGTVTIDDTLHVTGDVIAYYSSDERLKDNVKPIENAIDKIRMISGYEFDWNSSSKNEGHDIGVIAQEVEKILPEVVTTRSNGYKAVRYEKLTALLIQSNKELIEKVEELEKKLKNK